MKQGIVALLCIFSLRAGDYEIRNDTKGGSSGGGTIKVTLIGTKNEKKEFTLKLNSKDTWSEGLNVCLNTIQVEGVDGVVKDLKATKAVPPSSSCLSFQVSIKHDDYNEKEKKPGVLAINISST